MRLIDPQDINKKKNQGLFSAVKTLSSTLQQLRHVQEWQIWHEAYKTPTTLLASCWRLGWISQHSSNGAKHLFKQPRLGFSLQMKTLMSSHCCQWSIDSVQLTLRLASAFCQLMSSACSINCIDWISANYNKSRDNWLTCSYLGLSTLICKLNPTQTRTSFFLSPYFQNLSILLKTHSITD